MAVFLCLGLAISSGCSLMLNFEECSSETDCPDEGACSARGLCEAAETSPVALLGGPCDRFEGPDDDDLFYIGVILQLSGTGAGFGRPMLNAIMLAQEDFNGISGTNGRRIGLIICDTQAQDQRAQAAAEHLRDAGVTAIIGMNSSQVMTIAPQVTIPAKMLLVSPSATATTITLLDDEDLVWRTAPSDAIQGQALGRLLNHALEEVIALDIEEPSKVALLVRSNDRYASGLNDAVIASLPQAILAGGQARFSARDYPNVGAGQEADYSGVITALALEEVEPDAVVILGSAEAWEIAAGLDGYFRDKEPIYFVADAAKNAEEAFRAPASLQGRIWGTGPQNIGGWDYAPYVNFRVKYQRAYGADDPDQFQFIANAFDAVYAIALAASQGFTGPDLARGLAMLSSGEPFLPSPEQAQQALRKLREGTTINLMGASGPLDFDAYGDPVASPIALWCFDDTGVPERGVIFEGDLFTPLSCSDGLD